MQDRTPKTKPKAAELADRVAVLEREVASLKTTVASLGPEANSRMLQTFGVLPDDEISRSAEQLGRKWRERQPKC